ncbi:MAG: hypothetical protein ACYCSN_06090 [Acidobacteriaceae bacterium]
MRADIVNRFDDPQAYMAYPQKTLQTGYLQPEPFSERRIVTSLGSGYVLQALMLVSGDARSASFIDSGFGLLLYAAMLWALTRIASVSEIRSAWLLWMVLLLPLFKQNLTMVYLSAGLFLVVFALLVRSSRGASKWVGAIIVGIVAGAACTLKSSNIVFLFPALAFTGVWRAWGRKSFAAILPTVVSLLAAAAAMLPWMMQQKRDEGAYLFPLLGRGFHASAFGQLPLPAHTSSSFFALWLSLPYTVLLAMALLFAWRFLDRPGERWRAPLIGFLAAAAFATPILALSTGGEGADRYPLPFAVPVLLVFAAFFLGGRYLPAPLPSGLQKSAIGYLAVCLFFIGGLFGIRARLDLAEIHSLMSWIRMRPSHLLPWEYELTTREMRKEEERAARVQASIPAGEPVFEALFAAYPYVFSRNTIYIADYPGMAGWAPGIPVGKGPEPVRSYFLAHAIHYVVCDRRLASGNADIQEFLGNPQMRRGRTAWSREEDSVSRDVRHNLLLLAKTHRSVYDDGEVVAVDLSN